MPRSHQEYHEEELPPLRSGIGSDGEEQEKMCNKVTLEREATEEPLPISYTLYEQPIKVLETPEKLELLGVRLVGCYPQLHLRLPATFNFPSRTVSKT